MAIKVSIKKSSSASAVPTSSDLIEGQLAVNFADKRLFTEDASGNILELGINPSSITTGTITASGTVTFNGSVVSAAVAFTGGTIDGTVIGGSTPAAITGTTITGTSLVGPLTGNSTGTHTGAVTGDVTGNITGSGSSTLTTLAVTNFTAGVWSIPPQTGQRILCWLGIEYINHPRGYKLYGWGSGLSHLRRGSEYCFGDKWQRWVVIYICLRRF